MCINTTIIGLSATPIACFTDTPPGGYNTSESGYYLNDTEFGARILQDCQMAGWAILTAARAQAIREVQDDIRTKIFDRFENNYTPFKGGIGEVQFSGNWPQSKSRIGVDLTYQGRGRRGLKLIIEGAYLGLDTTGAFPLSIASNNPDFSLSSPPTLNATANQFVWNGFGTPIEIPLWTEVENSEGTGFRFSFARGSANPLDSKLYCCGGRPNWRQTFDVAGFASSSAAYTNADMGSSNLSMGLVLKGYLTCDGLQFICDLKELGGYDLQSIIARMVQFRAGIAVYSALLNQNIINVCTLYNRDEIQTHRNFLATKYNDNLNWLIAKMPGNLLECKCESTFIQLNHASL
jgi:hypothetical protein